MEQHIFWSREAQVGLEYLTLYEDTNGVRFDSVVLGEDEGEYFRLRYQIVTSPDWQVQSCVVRLLTHPERQITLRSSGQGTWTDEHDHPLTALDGCIDVDISVTPATNTLPIRRLKLVPGQLTELQVVYISVPELTVQPFRQRYTCLTQGTEFSVYRYESLESGFTRDLRVDQHGVVVDYPGIWQRTEPQVNS